MATELKLPNLGENIESGDVVKILVSEGDTIGKHQPVVEIETDKAVVEVPSPVTGTVAKIVVKEGDRAEVGQVLLLVDEDGAEKGKAEKEKKAARPKAKAEGEVEEEGDEDEAAGEEEARKGDAEEDKKEGAKAAAEEEEEEEEEDEGDRRKGGGRGEVVEFTRPSRSAASQKGSLVPAAPSVRRFAREIGVPIDQVRGTGPKGRISMEDVKAFARQVISRAGAAAAPAASAPPLPDFSKWGEVEREGFSGVRRKTAQHLGLAWSSIPHVTQYDRADVTRLEELRKRYAPRVEAEGGKLTVTAIILKVVSAALKVFPKFNASLDMAAEEIVYKKYYHLGVAVDTERGLLVPVIRDVDRKNLLRISRELSEMADKARRGKLSLEEMQGGTFTVTNLGGIGGTGFSPIVNAPEVAILGVARASQEPVLQGGEFRPRLLLPLSLSYDHRLIDGADAARFLRWVAEALEEPFLLSLEG